MPNASSYRAELKRSAEAFREAILSEQFGTASERLSDYRELLKTAAAELTEDQRGEIQVELAALLHWALRSTQIARAHLSLCLAGLPVRPLYQPGSRRSAGRTVAEA